MGKIFSDTIEKVSISMNLYNDPMVVLASKYGYSANYEKLAKAQAAAFKDERLSTLDSIKKNLEINPYNPIIKELLE